MPFSSVHWKSAEGSFPCFNHPDRIERRRYLTVLRVLLRLVTSRICYPAIDNLQIRKNRYFGFWSNLASKIFFESRIARIKKVSYRSVFRFEGYIKGDKEKCFLLA